MLTIREAAAMGREAAATSGEAAVRVHPLLERLGTESWPVAENQLLGLLSTGALETSEARTLATLGIVQAQLFGRFDLRSALTTLLPILEEAEREHLPRAVAARAHVLAALLFSSPDARFFDLGRVNAHVTRAQTLLEADDPAADDRVSPIKRCTRRRRPRRSSRSSRRRNRARMARKSL